VTAAVVERVAAGAWRDEVAGGLAHGARFAGAWAAEDEHGLCWRAALDTAAGPRILWCPVEEGRVDTLVDLVGAADWDEREAHDLYGVRFSGHEPLRALVDHPSDPRGWMVPVEGDGVHQVAVGPIHAGVIESGHFRFHVVGERILALDLRLFYKHRGLERAAEGLPAADAIAYAQRACAACAVANSVAYAQAVEQALGMWPDRDLRVARTLALELERLYNHVHDISAICSGVGYAPGAMAFAALKDRAQQLNERVAGHRFLFGAIAVGRGMLALDAATADRARSELRDLRIDAAAAWRELEFAGSFQARLDGVGVLGGDAALRLGAVGPAARAAGIRIDARRRSPRLWYGGFLPSGPREPTGDVAARLGVRAAELETTCDLLEDLLARPLPMGETRPADESAALGVGSVESARGATTCVVELTGGRPRVRRLHLRTGSYANWPALAEATAGNLLPDFPLINKSFELCYACADR
jgi:Ni,Fe-hydrogenase III large subunit